MKDKLNLGSGEDYIEGWLNVDCRDNVKKDLKVDLNKFPYPFKKNTFNVVVMKMILEHVSDPIRLLREIVKSCKNKAKIIITVPHAISYANISDIQHKNNFTENSFIDDTIREYELEELKLIRKEFIFKNKWKKYVPFKKYLKIYLNGMYDDIYFEFKVNKKS